MLIFLTPMIPMTGALNSVSGLYVQTVPFPAMGHVVRPGKDAVRGRT
jgi:hypothetical protein